MESICLAEQVVKLKLPALVDLVNDIFSLISLVVPSKIRTIAAISLKEAVGTYGNSILLNVNNRS